MAFSNQSHSLNKRGTGPDVRGSKRPLLACRTRFKYSMATFKRACMFTHILYFTKIYRFLPTKLRCPYYLQLDRYQYILPLRRQSLNKGQTTNIAGHELNWDASFPYIKPNLLKTRETRDRHKIQFPRGNKLGTVPIVKALSSPEQLLRTIYWTASDPNSTVMVLLMSKASLTW